VRRPATQGHGVTRLAAQITINQDGNSSQKEEDQPIISTRQRLHSPCQKEPGVDGENLEKQPTFFSSQSQNCAKEIKERPLWKSDCEMAADCMEVLSLGGESAPRRGARHAVGRRKGGIPNMILKLQRHGSYPRSWKNFQERLAW